MLYLSTRLHGVLFIFGLFYNTDTIETLHELHQYYRSGLERIWKLFEVAELRYCPGICLRRLNKITYRRLPLHFATRCHNLREQTMRWRILLMHWKVAGSIPDRFIEIFIGIIHPAAQWLWGRLSL
jgi:hypothetical protein